jgi:outer membrane receptor protein involved in Fe transport
MHKQQTKPTVSTTRKAPRIGLLASTIATVLGSGAALDELHAQDQEASGDEIVVTGSRIARRDFTASSPIVTVDSEAFQNTSQVSVEATLIKLPQFSGGGAFGDGTQFDNGDVQASAFNTPGAASVNLRGIGSNRNLVLIDGKRAQPANATLVVDINSIPTAAIESVEVITGGASAVYGADAIAGVTNFKFRRDFEGIDLDFQTGITEAGDGEESRFSGLLGANVGDTGNVMLGFEWADRQAAHDLERDFYVDALSDTGTPGGEFFITPTYWTPGFFNWPTQTAVNSVLAGGDPFSSFYFNPSASATQTAPNNTVFQQAGANGYTGPLLPEFKILSGGPNNGNLSQNVLYGLTSSPLTRLSTFGRGTLELSDNLSFFAQANYSSIEVDSVLAYSPAVQIWGTEIPRDAAHPVPAELATLLDSRPNPGATWQLNRVLDFIGPRRTENTTSVYQVMAGLEGEFENNDWTWEAYVSHGETEVLAYLNGGFASVQRWREVVSAPNYGAGYVRDAGLGYTIRCTSGMPVFADFTPSQDCLDAIDSRMKNWTSIDQTIAEFNLQGGLFDMPAGQLRFAVGASYRENGFLFEPDLLNDAESAVENPVGLFAANNTAGEIDVTELYGELLIPVFGDFNLELGYRHSDYSTEGGAETYKMMFDWGIGSSLRLRGGRQHANRAPNINELFTGPTLQVVGFPGSDPCTTVTTNPWGNLPTNPNRAQVQALCSAIINNPTSGFNIDPNNFAGPFGFFPLEIATPEGNPNLVSEEADTITLGVVVSGEQWNVAVDVYNIEIEQAIAPINSWDVYAKCFNADGASNPTYSIDGAGGLCRLIIRDPVSGYRFQVRTPFFNLGGIDTTGADLQFNWNGQRFGVNFAATIIDEYSTQSTPDSPFLDAAGTLAEGGQYDWRTYTTFRYSLGDAVDLGLGWRQLPEVKAAAIVQTPTSTVDPTSAYDLFDFYGNWSITDRTRLRFGIDNLLNTEPEIVGADPPNTNASGFTYPGYYDTLGQRFYLGLTLNF